MKHLLLFLLLPISFLQAQQPFGKNAEWHYSYSGFFVGDGNGYSKVYYHADTLINGNEYQWMKQIMRTILQTGPDSNDFVVWRDGEIRNFFYRTINEMVYQYDFDMQDSILFYDFNAVVGDTVYFKDSVKVPFSTCNQQPGYVVTGTGIEVVDGVSIPYWDIDSIFWGGYYHPNSRIYRNMGSLWSAGILRFYECDFIVPPQHTFHYYIRCFKDDDIDIVAPNWFSSCDHFVAVSVETFGDESNVKVYPNPANDRLFVEIGEQSDIVQMVIVDLQGKILLQKESQGSEVIDVQNLKAGLYLLQMFNASGQMLESSKWVKK